MYTKTQKLYTKSKKVRTKVQKIVVYINFELKSSKNYRKT